MKKIATILMIYLVACVAVTSFSSCSRKTGCPSTENASVKADRKGRLPTKRGKSSLYPKGMKKKKKKKN